MTVDALDPLAISVAEAAELLGISRTLAYGLVARQELPSFRLGGRIRIPRRWLDRLEDGLDGSLADPEPLAGKTRDAGEPEVVPEAVGQDAPPDPMPRAPSRPDRNRTRESRRATQLSLFEPIASPTHPSLSTPQPHPPTTPPRALPPSNRPDALAPGVRRGAVNVAGNRAGELWGLNGSLDAAGESC